MMVILNFRDGRFIEADSPIAGFENVYSKNVVDSGVGIIPEGTDFCPLDAYSQSGYLVSVDAAAKVAADRALRPFLGAPAPEQLALLGLDRLWVARSNDPARLPPASTVVPLDLLAHDPALHSCDYHLADKPLARALRDIASGFLVDHGLATQQQLSEPSVVWLISDTDLPDGALAIYTLLQWPGRIPPRTVVMTVFNRDWKVLGAVPVDLYAADEELIAP